MIAAAKIKNLQEQIAHNDGAFADKELFVSFYNPLLRLAITQLKSRNQAEEAVSDVFIHIWEKRNRIYSITNMRWAESNFFKNDKTLYEYTLPLGFDYGGTLFFSQYSFPGLYPRGLKDRYADYWLQNRNHNLINHAYCVINPKKFKGYRKNFRRLTASDTYNGYNAFGTVTPTAALSALPYTPEFSTKALRDFYNDLGDKIWSEYGFTDAYNETQNWYAGSHLAINQGTIIVMIENYRSGLRWQLFMSFPEIKKRVAKTCIRKPLAGKMMVLRQTFI
ncbi:MAG: glucoamylase family protein [Bacteroidota bacterium]